MTMPLVVLAVLSVVGGLLSIPAGFLGRKAPGFVEHQLMAEGAPVWFPQAPEEHFHVLVAVLGTAAALAGMFVAWQFYGSRRWSVDAFVAKIRPLHRVIENKFYFDHVYLWLVRQVQQRFAEVCAFFEKNILVQGVVNGLAGLTRWFGYLVRLLLDGHLHRYVTLALFGLVVVLAYLGMRKD